MPKLKQLPSRPNLPELEETVLEYWQKNKSFEKSVQMRDKAKSYVFYDGPPFATGLPHYGHLLGSTSKDVIARYWTMKGYRVERVWGWDCHGLPIENMLEKKLKIKGGKKGIESLGIDKFNQACKTEVLRLDTEWEKIIARLGRWVDFKNNYKTMDTTYMESVWWGFKQLYDKNLVYEGKRVILYCPRCSTPLSNFEIAMDNSYIDINEPSTTYKFKIKGEKNTYILAWSTTPWNKLATPALAVNPSLTYLKVKQGAEFYYLAETRAETMLTSDFQIIEKLKGKDLTRLEFELHFDFYPKRKKDERAGVIVADDFVSDSDGTGVVTLAIYGEDDLRVMQKENIQLIEHVDDEGNLKPAVKPWAGKSIWDINEEVDADLEKRGLIYKHEAHQHSVPVCYRCETRLYHAPIPAWFINVQKLKKNLIEQNEEMNWYPKHLKHGRFGKGLETAPDWNISRSRYWGTPMPIWFSNDKKHMRIIGSLEDLKRWAVNSKEVEKLTDIHREFLDNLEIWVDDNKKIKGKRMPEVFDCWVESGSMPFASKHYPFENKEEFESTYPAQFVSEYIAQTRAWFYTMHVMSVGVFGSYAVKNTLTTGTILAEDGNKMSKSKKNYPDPLLLINEYGVDSLRLYLMSSTVMKSENLNFSEREVSDIRKKVFLIWWNMFAFYKMYAPKNHVIDLEKTSKSNDVMDEWILSKLHTLIKNATKYMDNYDVVKTSRDLMGFVDELSTWYLRRSRERLRENQDSVNVFGVVLVRLAQLFAPFAPFFSELMWHNLVNDKTSVHHSDWPQFDSEFIHQELEEKMEAVKKVVEKTHALRNEAGIKVRQPLAKITCYVTTKEPKQNLIEVLADEVNVKQVDWKYSTETLRVILDTKLTPKLEAEGEARELMRNIQKLRKKAGLKVGDSAKVQVPEWPKNWKKEIEDKTNTTLVKGKELELITEIS